MKPVSIRNPLIAILLLSIVLRLGAAFLLGNTLEGSQQERIFDQVSYNALASAILDGRGYSFEKYWYPFTPANTPTAHWSFLYPLYLAGIYSLFGEQPLFARMIQAVISGILSILLVYQLGRHLFNRRVGLVASGLTSVYFYFIFHDAALMTESFFMLGVLSTFLLVLKLVFPSAGASPTAGLANRPILAWLLLGALIGITALLRQTILLWAPFLFLWILAAVPNRSLRLWHKISGLLVTAAVVVVFILPWTLRNYRVYHAFLPLNSNAGYAIYAANHPDHGTQFIQDYVAPLPGDLRGQGLNEAQWNTALTQRAASFILEDPLRYIRLSLSRIPIFFNFWVSSQSSLSGNLARVLSFGVYLPFFIYGLIIAAKSWRRHSLIYLFVLVFSLLHILTWASIRYRLVIDMLLMPYASLALLDVVGRFSAASWFPSQWLHEKFVRQESPLAVRKENP